jgi:transposase-like protein
VSGGSDRASGVCSTGRVKPAQRYRDSTWRTRAGTIELHIPKLCKGSSFPGFLAPRRMAGKAPTAVIQEAYILGVSTRSVDVLVQAMGMTSISKVKSVACAARSTTGCKTSCPGRSKATGPLIRSESQACSTPPI